MDEVLLAKNRVGRLDHLVKPPEGLDLQQRIFAHRFDDEIAIGKHIPIDGEFDPINGIGARIIGQFPAADRAVERFEYLVSPTLHGLRISLDNDDLQTLAGTHLGDASPHQPTSEDTNTLDRTTVHSLILV